MVTAKLESTFLNFYVLNMFYSFFSFQVWREDFIGDIVEKKKEILIPLIVYFCEETERALFMDISANGRPVCQATGV